MKRNLFAEISKGFEALAEERQSKRTLKTHEVEIKPVPTMDAAELTALRERLHLSRAVLARYLRKIPAHWKTGNRAALSLTPKRRS
jgi:putative transcriptional regulator